MTIARNGMSSIRHFEYIDHTADIIVRAYGETIEEAFACAAEAMFAVITDSAEIRPTSRETVDIESIDREGLLVGFLSRLVVLHETEMIVVGDVSVTLAGNVRLRADFGTEPFDPARHGEGTQVKGISYYMMEICEESEGNPAHVQVLFDI